MGSLASSTNNMACAPTEAADGNRIILCTGGWAGSISPTTYVYDIAGDSFRAAPEWDLTPTPTGVISQLYDFQGAAGDQPRVGFRAG